MTRIRSWLAGHAIDLSFTKGTEPLAAAFAHKGFQDQSSAELTISFDVDKHFVTSALKESENGLFCDRRTGKFAWLSSTPPNVQTLSFDGISGGNTAFGSFTLGDIKDLDGSIRTRPGIDIISAWAANRGILPIHASGIALEGRALILLGVGGSGKTTTALALAQRGWELLGDDRCFLYREGLQIKVASLYATTFLTSESLSRLKAGDWPDLGDSRHGKHARSLPSTARIAETANLVGGIWVSPDAQSLYKLQPLSRRQALVPWQLALSPALHSLGPSPALLRGLSDLSHKVVSWRLGLNWDFDQIDKVFRDMVSRQTNNP
jgi:hypothetical protein